MCSSNGQFQLVNPMTQVALSSFCLGNCLDLQSIEWNIYQGVQNSSMNTVRWMIFNQMISYENTWFFGRETSHFTATNQLFVQHSQINLWRFEVIYRFSTEISTSTMDMITDQSPSNGSCFITPQNGTTTTVFTVSCLNWSDENGIKDYSLFGMISSPHPMNSN